MRRGEMAEKNYRSHKEGTNYLVIYSLSLFPLYLHLEKKRDLCSCEKSNIKSSFAEKGFLVE